MDRTASNRPPGSSVCALAQALLIALSMASSGCRPPGGWPDADAGDASVLQDDAGPPVDQSDAGRHDAGELDASTPGPNALAACPDLPTVQGVLSSFDPDSGYYRRPVLTPVGDGLSLAVPDAGPSQRLIRCGLVDVSQAPFQADPSGMTDATQALRAAIDFARRHQLITYFPPGTYLITDTLECAQGLYVNVNNALSNDRNGPCVLRGARNPGRPRPVLELKEQSPGFGDASRPKPMIHLWARSWVDPLVSQPNISMNQTVSGIDLRMRAGNAGAVGIQLQGAQGSGVEDVTVDATHGLGGLMGGSGSGGSHARITVIGGRYGLDLTDAQPVSTIVGITLTGQSGPALLYRGLESLSAVGLKIVVPPGNRGPAIAGVAPISTVPNSGYLCIVDSEVSFTEPHPSNVAVQSTRSFYLRNVFFENAGVATRIGGGGDGGVVLTGERRGWQWVQEHAVSVRPPPIRLDGGLIQWETPLYTDGVRQSLPIFTQLGALDGGPPSDLTSRHVWADDFPAWEQSGAVNVRAGPYWAKGDGVADDSEPLERAIRDSEVVFLPKGYYRLSRPLVLGPSTKLLGVAPHLSILMPVLGSPAFADGGHPQPLLATVDDSLAETQVAFLGVLASRESPGAFALRWQSGARSLFRDVHLLRESEFGQRPISPPALDAP